MALCKDGPAVFFVRLKTLVVAFVFLSVWVVGLSAVVMWTEVIGTTGRNRGDRWMVRTDMTDD